MSVYVALRIFLPWLLEVLYFCPRCLWSSASVMQCRKLPASCPWLSAWFFPAQNISWMLCGSERLNVHELPGCLHLKPSIFLNYWTLCMCAVQFHQCLYSVHSQDFWTYSSFSWATRCPDILLFDIIDVQAVLSHPHKISRKPGQRASLMMCYYPIFSHTWNPLFCHLLDGIFLTMLCLYIRCVWILYMYIYVCVFL